MHLFIQLHHMCLSLKHIQPARAASVLCIRGSMMLSCCITEMETHPVDHNALYGQHGGRNKRTGNTLESDVHLL